MIYEFSLQQVDEMVSMNHFPPNPTIKNEPGDFNETPVPQPMEGIC